MQNVKSVMSICVLMKFDHQEVTSVFRSDYQSIYVGRIKSNLVDDPGLHCEHLDQTFNTKCMFYYGTCNISFHESE